MAEQPYLTRDAPADTEVFPVINQEKLQRDLPSYINALTRELARDKPFMKSMAMDERLAKERIRYWLPKIEGMEDMADQFVDHLDKIIHANTIQTPLPKILIRFAFSRAPMAPQVLPEPHEYTTVACMDSVRGTLLRCIVPPSDETPTLETMAIRAGVIVVCQPVPAIMNRFADNMPVSYGGGPGMYGERNRDPLISGDDEGEPFVGVSWPEYMKLYPALNAQYHDIFPGDLAVRDQASATEQTSVQEVATENEFRETAANEAVEERVEGTRVAQEETARAAQESFAERTGEALAVGAGAVAGIEAIRLEHFAGETIGPAVSGAEAPAETNNAGIETSASETPTAVEEGLTTAAALEGPQRPELPGTEQTAEGVSITEIAAAEITGTEGVTAGTVVTEINAVEPLTIEQRNAAGEAPPGDEASVPLVIGLEATGAETSVAAEVPNAVAETGQHGENLSAAGAEEESNAVIAAAGAEETSSGSEERPPGPAGPEEMHTEPYESPEQPHQPSDEPQNLTVGNQMREKLEEEAKKPPDIGSEAEEEFTATESEVGASEESAAADSEAAEDSNVQNVGFFGTENAQSVPVHHGVVNEAMLHGAMGHGSHLENVSGVEYSDAFIAAGAASSSAIVQQAAIPDVATAGIGAVALTTIPKSATVAPASAVLATTIAAQPLRRGVTTRVRKPVITKGKKIVATRKLTTAKKATKKVAQKNIPQEKLTLDK